jgi:hypothetical protein
MPALVILPRITYEISSNNDKLPFLQDTCWQNYLVLMALKIYKRYSYKLWLWFYFDCKLRPRLIHQIDPRPADHTDWLPAAERAAAVARWKPSKATRQARNLFKKLGNLKWRPRANPGPNPTTLSYNARVVIFFNATGSLARFENNFLKFYFEKRSSLLQRWFCIWKFKSRRTGSRSQSYDLELQRPCFHFFQCHG